MNCPVCGEEVLYDPSMYENGQVETVLTPPQVEETRRHLKSIAPIKQIYKVRLLMLIAVALAFIVGIIEAAAINSYIKETMEETKFEDLTTFLKWGLVAIQVITFLLFTGVVYALHELAGILPSFRKAANYGIASVVLTGVEIFVSSPIISLAGGIVDILLIKYYCESMSELCLPRYHKASRQWTLYWKIFCVLTILSVGFGCFVNIKLAQADNRRYWGYSVVMDTPEYLSAYIYWMYVSLAFTFIAGVVNTLLEMHALRTTRKTFETQS